MGHNEQGHTQAKSQVICLDSLHLQASALTITSWNCCSFAPEWFKDALSEARTGQDHNSLRREIVFAVCFVESYLFEWVRDEVLNRDFNELRKYFPPKDHQGIRERWKKVIKHLEDNDKIPKAPSFARSDWCNFVKLVKYRDGLVHAGPSRPETKSPMSQARVPPEPSKTELDQRPAGWAVSVVVKLVRHLHDAVGTPPPEWLADP